MPLRHRRRRFSWSQRVAATLAALFLIAGGGLIVVRSLDRSTPLSESSAIDRFRGTRGGATPPGASISPPTTQPSAAPPVEGDRAANTAAPPPHPDPRPTPNPPQPSEPTPAPDALPREGVYSYATRGWEEVDTLGGARHDYPERTTITLGHEGCGLRFRWDALEERWDEMTTCITDAGEEQRTFTTYHEFFGQSDRQTFECAPGSLVRPKMLEPGHTWSLSCASGSTENRGEGVVVGRETLDVDGEPVETVHLHLAFEITGRTRGTSVSDNWILPSTGLLVRRTSSTDTESDTSVGTARYREEYELHLTSTEPRT